MNAFKKYPQFVKYSCFISITSSLGWIYYQIRTTQDILNNALDTSILHIVDPIPETNTEYNKSVVEEKWLKQQATKNVLSRIWDGVKFSYARRLLSLANSDNQVIRRKAVSELAGVKLADNWHCSMLANMMSPETAVGLARCSDVDKRLFIEPPLRYLTYNRDMIVQAMKDFLLALYEKSRHPCMGYFISKVFVDEQDEGRIVDNESTTVELTKFIQKSSGVLPLCLESLVHHASIEKYARDIVSLNGLPLLLEMHNRYKNNIDVNITLCRIISCLSFYPELLNDIFKSGWIGILAEWVEDEDIRLSVPAARALANLDKDERAVYPRNVYLLHPSKRNTKRIDVDIVLVHGLLGGVFFTWRQRNKDQNVLGFIGKSVDGEDCISPDASYPKQEDRVFKTSDPSLRHYVEEMQAERSRNDLSSEYELVWDDIPINCNEGAEGPFTCPASSYPSSPDLDKKYTFCWPRDWLPDYFSNLRIIGIDYNTSLSMWAPICPSEPVKQNLEERSDELMAKLLKAGVGKKPIIWITHSMGGLIVKNMLCKAYESGNKAERRLCKQTKGIVFYSTPHVGSSLATLSQATSLLLWPSVEVQELREDSPKLAKMHKAFLKIAKELQMKVVTFVETKSTVVTAMKFNFVLVQPHSGNPGIGEYYEIPQDHLGICKPANRRSFLYQKVVDLINSVLRHSS